MNCFNDDFLFLIRAYYTYYLVQVARFSVEMAVRNGYFLHYHLMSKVVLWCFFS